MSNEKFYGNRGQRQDSRQSSQQKIYFSDVTLNELKKDDILKSAKEFATDLGENFKSNQLRKYYNEIMALKSKYRTKVPGDSQLALDMAIFLSKIEYGKNKARSGEKNGFEFFLKNIETLVEKINKYNPDFINFATIMESIVAYFPKQN